MSSLFVREKIQAAWPTLTPSLPFFATINDAPTNLEVEVPIWGTLVYDVITRRHVTMGKNPWIVEEGTATIALMSYSGVGDDEISAVSETVMKAWDLWQYDDSLWIQAVEGPRPPDLEAIGDVYRMLVVLTYNYQTRGGL
jgi:hypothetical protein